MSYLDDGTIRLGVDLEKGGVITYLATSRGGRNVVNSWDLGREIQASYYGGPVPFGQPRRSPWQGWPWNPVGAGDSWGNPSRVVAYRNDGRTLYVESIPMEWALDNVACRCSFETWITVRGRAVFVLNRLTNFRSDTKQYPARNQELPAVYTVGRLHRLFTYTGSSPYRNRALTEIRSSPKRPFRSWPATEHWAALVDDRGFGLGVFNPEVTEFAGGFCCGVPGKGGPGDQATGYLAPHTAEILDHDIVYEYRYALVLGALRKIRAFAVARRPDDRPDYVFRRDRQHFTYTDASDRGTPEDGVLRVELGRSDPQIIGPEQWWDAAAVPKLYIVAAFHTHQDVARVFWSVPSEGFSAKRRLSFTVQPDGRLHTYTVDLAASPAYRGTITRLRLDPVVGPGPDAFVEIASITSKP